MSAPSTDPVARVASIFGAIPRPRKFGPVNVVGLLSLVRREAMREMRWFGVTMIGPAIQAALFATVFSLAAGENGMAVDGWNFLEFLGAGLVISAVMQRALETTGYSIMFDKLESGGLQDILGAPLMPMEVLAAYLVTAISVSVSIGLIIWGVMSIFGLGLPVHPLASAYFLCIGGGTFSMLGLIGAIFSKKWDSFSGKETFVVLPLIFLSGTFFPLSAVPEGPWQLIFKLNPIYYLVDGFRWSVIGRLETAPLVSAGVTALVFLVLLAIGARLLATGYKLKP
ncbi:MAG: ABC transporter permease [Alphaproteobacteria bacterium]|nr:ABC transporter permease [Alphaproteobacteria bacterium]